MAGRGGRSLRQAERKGGHNPASATATAGKCGQPWAGREQPPPSPLKGWGAGRLGEIKLKTRFPAQAPEERRLPWKPHLARSWRLGDEEADEEG